MEHKTGFEWHYEKTLHSWQEGLTEWVATIPTKYWVLLGVAGVTIILILCLPLFSSKKEEEVFTPPPIEPWPETLPVEPITDEPVEAETEEESDEYRDMEIAALVNLKREMAREKEDLELETRKQKVAQQESEAKVKNVEANMRTKFGL